MKKEKKVFDIIIKTAINVPSDSKSCFIKVISLMGNNRFKTIKETQKVDAFVETNSKDKAIVAEWNKPLRIVTSLTSKMKEYRSKLVLFDLRVVSFLCSEKKSDFFKNTSTTEKGKVECEHREGGD